MFSKKG
jgi:hypothetical protein